MTGRGADLVRELNLRPHPEGGYYIEIDRSTSRVVPDDGRSSRAALTTIYFLLARGQVSRWHRVLSDEVWHFYEGAPLELFTLTPDAAALTVHRLGGVGLGRHPVRTVPARWWQAARTSGDYSLAGCTVAPGFEFADFALASDVPELAERIRAAHASVAMFL